MPEPLTLITYMFLHAGWLHLISNMLFLWVFADNVEDAFGHCGFLDLLSDLRHRRRAYRTRRCSPTRTPRSIGASGAVSGVLGAYILLFPRARVWILLFMRIPLRIPAVLGRWAAGSRCRSSAFSSPPRKMTEVAWWAHIGGFLAGLVADLRAALAAPGADPSHAESRGVATRHGRCRSRN